MLNAMIENRITEHGLCGHYLRKEMTMLVKPFLFSIIIYNMKFLATLQAKTGKIVSKGSYREIR